MSADCAPQWLSLFRAQLADRPVHADAATWRSIIESPAPHADDADPIGPGGHRHPLTSSNLTDSDYRLMVDAVDGYAIFMLDPTGRIESWNLGAQKTKGYEASEIIGRHFSVFYPPEAVAKDWPGQELEIALRDGRMEDEGWRVRKDGSRFWASVVITALHDASGRHRGFAKVTRDLTERRRITALEDEGRRVTTFLAMLGHELRNPLAPISNAMALLEREETSSRVVHTTREIIGRQLRQLTRLVDDLLDVGRITSGKIRLESRPVRLADAMTQAVEVVRPLSDAKTQSLDVQGADEDLWVAGDRARLVQIFSNLLNNAAKFTPAGGRIDVRLWRADSGDAEVSVRDNGPGIAPRDLQHVFDLFVQGEQDPARLQGGLGLGLSLVQQLTALHGGSVSAFSSGRAGEGCEFIVQLPTVQPPPSAQSEAGDTRGRRVLVVDDNRDAAETMAMLLEALGYSPGMAFDGPGAIEAIRATSPDVVLLDIGLPGLSGVEVAIRVRAEMTNPPALIAVTGYGQERDRELSLEAGFHAHMTKPVDVERLSALLEQLTGAARQTTRA